MKKILLASTAIVGFAGMAVAADVKISGKAEMGIMGGNDVETQYSQDLDIKFTFSSVTDNGVEFGAYVKLADSSGDPVFGRTAIGNSAGNARVGGIVLFDDEYVWVSGAYGKVTLGNTDGAFDWALQEIYNGSSINDDHTTHAGAFQGTGLDGKYDNQIMRYEYAFGQVAVGVSAEMDDDRYHVRSEGIGAVVGDENVNDVIWGLGVKWAGSYSGVDLTAGAAYQQGAPDYPGQDNHEIWGLSGGAVFANGISVNLGYADLDETSDMSGNAAVGYTYDPVTGAINGTTGLGGVDNWYGVNVGYTMGALTLGLNYGKYSASDKGVDDPEGWGAVANYDLGGGAVIQAGYGSSSGDDASGNSYTAGNGNGDETWSVGLAMSF